MSTYAGWRVALSVADPGCRQALLAGLTCMLLIAGVADVCALLWPRRCSGALQALAVAQRVMRIAWTLGWLVTLSAQDWHGLLMVPPGGVVALLEVLVLLSLLWMFQALIFPVKFPVAVVLQGASGTLGCWCLRTLACAVRADSNLARQARTVCRASQHVKQLALTAGGAVGVLVPVKMKLCDEVAMEVLLPLFAALSSLLVLYITYTRELTLKCRHVEMRAEETSEPLQLELWWSPSPSFHVVGSLVILIASFVCAESAATWGTPYQC